MGNMSKTKNCILKSLFILNIKLAKLVTSGAESGNLNTSPSSNQTRNSEKFEKPENEIEAQLICEPPINRSSTPSTYMNLLMFESV